MQLATQLYITSLSEDTLLYIFSLLEKIKDKQSLKKTSKYFDLLTKPIFSQIKFNHMREKLLENWKNYDSVQIAYKLWKRLPDSKKYSTPQKWNNCLVADCNTQQLGLQFLFFDYTHRYIIKTQVDNKSFVKIMRYYLPYCQCCRKIWIDIHKSIP